MLKIIFYLKYEVLEQMSSHPSAQAIVRSSKKKSSMIFLYQLTFMRDLVWELKDILMENI